MILTLLVLALLIGAVGFIILAARRLHGQRIAGYMFRRGFQYALLFALVITVANGLTDLLARGFGSRPAFDDPWMLAQSVTAAVIALPITGLLVWWIIRGHRRDPTERESLLYQGYVTAAALTGAGITAVKLTDSLTTALGMQVFDGTAVAGLVVWALVWVIHWRVIQRTLTRANGVVHLLLGSTIGLGLAGLGLINLLATSLDLLTGHQILVGPFVPLGAAAGMFISGGLLWSMYWLLSASRLPRGTAWHVYVLLLGVAGGLISGLIGAQALLTHGLVQWLGEPQTFVHWFDWPEALGAFLVGALVWWYHVNLLDWSVNTPVRRVYRYLVSGIGVLAAAAGAGMLVVALIGSITPATLYHHPGNTLIGGLTLLVIAAPVWWWHWRGIQRAIDDAPQVELPTVARRIYLVVLIGTAAIASIIALIMAVADIIHDIMQDQFALTTVYLVRTELGWLAAGAVIIAYHAAIVQQDQRRAPAEAEPQPAPPPVRTGTIVLVGPIDPTLALGLLRRYQRPVQFLGTASVTSWNTAAVQAQIEAHDPAADLLITARENGLHTQPLEEIRYLFQR